MTSLFKKDINIGPTYSKENDLTLFLGDCLDLLKQIPDNSIQLVVTSPPYNIGKEYEKRQKLQNYLDFQEKVIKECYRVLKPEGSICWQTGNYVDVGQNAYGLVFARINEDNVFRGVFWRFANDLWPYVSILNEVKRESIFKTTQRDIISVWKRYEATKNEADAQWLREQGVILVESPSPKIIKRRKKSFIIHQISPTLCVGSECMVN